MDLRRLLLGLLADRPGSGYELRKRIFDPVRPSQSQVYRTLNDMAEEGLLTFDKVEQDKVPAKKMYTLTEAGVSELDRWLIEVPQLKLERDPFLIQLMFGHRLDRQHVMDNLVAYADEARRQLAWIKKTAKRRVSRAARSSGNPMRAFFRTMVIDHDIAQLEARLKWADEAIQQILNSVPDSIEAMDPSSGEQNRS